MFSDRTPESLASNAWAERRDALTREGRPLLDLTLVDPTRTGLAPLAGAAAALAGIGAPEYEPESLGAPAARAAVAGALSQDGVPIDAGAVALTASTSEAYAHCFRLFCNCGAALAVPAPGYPLIEHIARAEGVELRPYRLQWDGDWYLDRASVVSALDGARALVTVEPAYPTGAVLAPHDRAFLLDACAARGLPIVADEVFRTPRTAGVSWASGTPPTLVVALGGLSKTCGLPQLKLAWSIFAGPRAIREDALRRFGWLEDLFLGVPTPVQRALPQLLELRHAFRASVATRLAQSDAVLARWCADVAEVSAPPAGESWAQPLRLPGRFTGEAWAGEALEAGVVVQPGEPFELAPGSHVVVSRLLPPDLLAQGLAGLGRVIARQPA